MIAPGQASDPPSPAFIVGRLYARREIHDCLGGSIQSFLPFVRGRVVAACLTPRLNPQAPRLILVGDGPGILRAARLLAVQREPIPVFMKRGVGSWEFVGQYVVAGSTEDRAQCEAAARASGREDAIVAVIELTAATP